MVFWPWRRFECAITLNKKSLIDSSFRKVLSTGPHSQLIVMSLQPGEDLGSSAHFADQLFLIEQGTGELTIEGMFSPLVAGDLVHVPGGAHHNISANSDEALRLVVVCSPPHYMRRCEHETKADAIEAESEEESLAYREAHREYAKTRSRFFASERE